MAEIRSMEYSTLKVPYEILNKKFRTAQKSIDREVDQAQNTSREMNMAMSTQLLTIPCISEVNTLMSCVVRRLQILKRKANDGIEDELNATMVCKRKLQHLKDFIFVDNIQVKQAADDQWKRIRMDRMVVEHLLRMGFYETAEHLAARSGIHSLTNLDVFHVSREIEDDLNSRKTTKCIMWCNDNKSKLRKINSNLEFNLRVQEFIDLIRNNLRTDAVKYARKYFPTFEKTQLGEICKCMALLAYPADTDTEPYKSLFDSSRWDLLVTNFRNENYRLFQLSLQSWLSVAIQAGLSSLKTPHCYSPTCKNLNCPVCQDDFNAISKHLPYSHCVQSRLICRITGLPLNEHNTPMMLPNGQIFGQLAIAEMTRENGTVVCPITNTIFSNPKIEKVFIM